MKKRIWKFTLLFGFTLSMFVIFAEGSHVGKGGDPVEQMFENARLDAMIILKQFNNHPIAVTNQSDYQDAISFLNRSFENFERVSKAMETDLATSKFIYLEDRKGPEPLQPTCARTNVPSQDGSLTDIRFSLALCNNLLNQQDAKKLARQLVLHEISHHFGLTSSAQESLAIRVGLFLDANAIAASTPLIPNIVASQRNNEPDGRIFAMGSMFGSSKDKSTNTKAIIWGGCQALNLPVKTLCNNFLNSGSIFRETNVTWEALPETSLLEPRALGGSASLPNLNSFVIWGGCSDDDNACRIKYNNGAIYDDTSQEWEPLPEIANFAGRSHFEMKTIDESVFIFGGAETLNGKNSGLRDGAVLTKQSEQWLWKKVVPPFAISGRFSSASVEINGTIYIWGGCATRGIFYCSKLLADGLTFTITDGNEKWSILPPIPFDFAPRSGHSMVALDEFIVIWGGEGANGALSDGAIYNTKEQTWESFLAPKSFARYGHSGLVLNQDILFFGGESSRGQNASGALRLRLAGQNAKVSQIKPYFVLDTEANFELEKKGLDWNRIGTVTLQNPESNNLDSFVWGGLSKEGNDLSHLIKLKPVD